MDSGDEQNNVQIEEEKLDSAQTKQDTELKKEDRTMATKLPTWFGVCMFILLLLNVKMYSDIRSLKQEARNFNVTANNLNSSIMNVSSNTYMQIQSLLNRRQSIVNEFAYELGKPSRKGVTMNVLVKPKEYMDNDKLVFILRNGNESREIKAKSVDKINFRASIDISIFKEYDLDLLIENGASRKIEKLGSIPRQTDVLSQSVNVLNNSGTVTYDKDDASVLVTGEYQCSYNGNSKDFEFSEVVLQTIVNGKVIHTNKLELLPQGYPNLYHIELKNHSIPCKPGDVEQLTITAKDKLGFSYRCIVQESRITDDAGMMSSGLNTELFKVIVK